MKPLEARSNGELFLMNNKLAVKPSLIIAVSIN